MYLSTFRKHGVGPGNWGNDGWDVIADWSYSAETEAQMEQIQRGAALLGTAIETKYGW